MAWRVESRTDRSRWVAHDGDQWTADETTRPHLIALAAGPQLLTPTGPAYVPEREGDETAVYLAACSLVPAPQIVGTPPPRPQVDTGAAPPGTVY